MRKVFLVLACSAILAGSAGAESPRRTPVVKVVNEWAGSVVNISTERVVLLQQTPFWGNYGPQFDSWFQSYFQNIYSAMKLKSIGSGVVVSKDGLIVTNAHVIHMASKIFVMLQNGQTLEASLAAINADDDLALIRVHSPEPLRPIQFADDMLIGETVVAIGNSFGLQNSVSVGVVSGTNRMFYSPEMNHHFTDLIQMDASINPGSSGGALLNLEGKLAGINLAVVQNAQTIGFAISADKVKYLLSQYEKLRSNKK